MKKIIFYVIFFCCTICCSAQTVKTLTTARQVKRILPEGTYIVDSSIKAKKGYVLEITKDKKSVKVMQRVAGGDGIVTGTFACGGCNIDGLSCELITGDEIIICTGCTCKLIVEKAGSRFFIKNFALRL